jgi:hypothetical protein
MVESGQPEMGAESWRAVCASARAMTAFARTFSDAVREPVKNQQNLRDFPLFAIASQSTPAWLSELRERASSTPRSPPADQGQAMTGNDD